MTDLGTPIAEGKTKIIYPDPDNSNYVLIRSKDDITAGDGAKRDLLVGKGALANRTTCNCFKLLNKEGSIYTHFVEQVDEITFRALRVKMLPLELVARRIATGSYLKRNPEAPEGYRFEHWEAEDDTALPEVELFLKDDSRHDPFVIFDSMTRRLHLFNPKKPLKDGYLGWETPQWLDDLEDDTFERMRYNLIETFTCIEKAWAAQNVTLVDLKIEVGFPVDGQIVVADVIDNDSWRIWPRGERKLMVDKQVYRDLPESTPEAMKDVLAKYTWVANATDKFVA